MRSLQRLLRSRLVRAAIFIFAVWNVVEVHYISRRLQQGAAASFLGSGSGSGGGVAAKPRRDATGDDDHQQKSESRSSDEKRWQHSLDRLQESLRLKRPLRVYIASLHWNNEQILRSHWNAAVLDLARALGPANIFVSVHEGGSWDGSAALLRELDAALGELGVPREVVIGSKTHEDEIITQPPDGTPGWIVTPRGRRELRRIPYLSRLRNRSLEPLRNATTAAAEAGTTGADGASDDEDDATTPSFDVVLFLNDVVFTVDDVLNLMATNEGHYAAACSLDFSRPPYYYDTFALRDRDGHEHATQSWPYFRSSQSRHAMKLSLPVPVKSCWNGMIAMPARPFLTGAAGSPSTSDGTEPDLLHQKPLSFRGVDDSLALHHVEGSECCLIHADNPLSARRGVYLNPNVRVGYNGDAYAAVNPPDGRPWLSSFQILSGLWRNRVRRTLTTPTIKEWKIRRILGRWAAEEEGRVEKGDFCLINEMQVLVGNGWAHL